MLFDTTKHNRVGILGRFWTDFDLYFGSYFHILKINFSKSRFDFQVCKSSLPPPFAQIFIWFRLALQMNFFTCKSIIQELRNYIFYILLPGSSAQSASILSMLCGHYYIINRLFICRAVKNYESHSPQKLRIFFIYFVYIFRFSSATTTLITSNYTGQSGNESNFHFPLRCASLVLRFPAYESLSLLRNWMKESQITRTAARPFYVHPWRPRQW